jgi:serine/threonine protein kinase
MSEAALTAWTQRFGARQVKFNRNDPEPFTSSKRLGHGGCGFVDEVSLGGIALALKRTYPRKITACAKKEIEILSHVSTNRHKHIVELIGSYVYTERRRGTHELGIVIWPVAHCDLSHFLQELSVLANWVDGLPSDDEDLNSAIETLSAISIPTLRDFFTDNKHLYIKHFYISYLYNVSLQRLATFFGCIANAVAWLHNEAHVRHRDLKPAQILLSQDGIWLTDFGLANFIPDLDNSATSGVENFTRRYQAPERALGLPRGRSEDVFGLGCIYLEMEYTLCGLPIQMIAFGEPEEAWSYQANVRQDLQKWLNPLKHKDFTDLRKLVDLIEAMLAFDLKDRPNMSSVVDQLSICSIGTFNLYGRCCLSGVYIFAFVCCM